MELAELIELFPENERGDFRNRLALSQECQAFLEGAAERKRNGEEFTREYIYAELDKIAVAHGFESGLPVPHLINNNLEHRLILHRRAPLSYTRASVGDETEAAQELRLRLKLAIVNSWETPEYSVTICRTEEGLRVVRELKAGARLRKLIVGLELRQDISMNAEMELRAMTALKEIVEPHQYDQYVLNGAFLERSKRSDLVYVFRKGLPTLVVSHHGDYEDGHVITTLCLHPMGYYEFTNVGTMTPTDEVIAALLMMRADEHGYWKESGQWPAYDTRSGL